MDVSEDHMVRITGYEKSSRHGSSAVSGAEPAWADHRLLSAAYVDLLRLFAGPWAEIWPNN